MKKKTCTIFLDASIIFESVQIDSIKWTDIASSDSINLIVSLPLIDELEAKKADGTDRLKSVARDQIPKLEAHLRGQCVFSFSKTVALTLHDLRTPIDFFVDGLVRGWKDDELIASALHYQQLHSLSDIYIASNDSGLRLRLGKFRISPIVLGADSMRPSTLPDRPRREERRPKVSLSALDAVDGVIRLKIPNEPLPNDADVVVFLNKLDGVAQSTIVSTSSHPQRLSSVPSYTNYLKRIAQYIDEHRKHSEWRRSIMPIQLSVSNTNGTAYASSTHIELRLDRRVLHPDDLRVPPALDVQSGPLAALDKIVREKFPPFLALDYDDDFSDFITILLGGCGCHGANLEIDLGTVPHGRAMEVATLYLIDDPIDPHKDAIIEYNVVCAELHTPVTGAIKIIHEPDNIQRHQTRYSRKGQGTEHT